MHMFIRNLFNVHSTFIAAYEFTELNQALCKESREALWKGHEYDTAPEKGFTSIAKLCRAASVVKCRSTRKGK